MNIPIHSRHLVLPQKGMTPEELGAWIVDNNIETRIHEEKIDYTTEEIAAFEHDSAAASIAERKLVDLLASFKEPLTEGCQEEKKFTIEPTKGTKVIKANREYADKQIEKGYRMDLTTLYGLPYPTTKKIIFVDIEGNHWQQYDYKMNPFQLEKYTSPLFETDDEKEFDLKKAYKGGTGTEDDPFLFKV
jgi:hypothetical protein